MAQVGQIHSYQATVDIPSIAANTTDEVAVTIKGVLATDHFIGAEIVSALNAGLGFAGGYVSAADTVTLRFQNSTAGALNPASATMQLTLSRGDDGTGDHSIGGGPLWAG